MEAEKQMKMFKSCLTMQEIFSQQKNACQGLTYRRIPIPDFCAPKEQVLQGWDRTVLPPSQAIPAAVRSMSLGHSVPLCPRTMVACPCLVLGCLLGQVVSPGNVTWSPWMPSAGQG